MIVVSTLLLAALSGQAPPIRTGADVVRAMAAKYPSWYRKLTFVQRAIFADGRPEEEWWEAVLIPGHLRIDIAPIDSGRAIIYRGDSNFVYQQGKRAGAVKGRNILAIMAFDVYAQPAERTLALVGEEGYDLGQLRQDRLNGFDVYVIGAPGKELWIEKDRLLLHRVVQSGPVGATSEITFSKFQPLAGGWIGTEVLFVRGGKEYFREIYRDWKVNDAVTEELFQAGAWKRPGWIPR